MTAAAAQRERVAEKIGNRRLVWFGIRGEDAVPLAAVPQFKACYAMTALAPILSLDENVAIETVRRQRVDLDTHDIDEDGSADVLAMRRSLLGTLARPSVVLPYRPTRFLSSLHFANLDTCLHAGMFYERQRVFDHKPWVETQLASRGIATVPWTYVADENRFSVVRQLESGPVVLRASRSTGGVGIVLLREADHVDIDWPRRTESLVSVAPYLSRATPLNATGCVFDDGTVTVHPVSVQLVGIAAATRRPYFGYCGNDFAAAKRLKPVVLDRIQALMDGIGAWLHHQVYRGVFGVDLLVDENDEVMVTEINPRFQGSSMLSAEIAVQLGEPDLYLDQLSAFLDEKPEVERRGVRDWAEDQPDLAQIVCHNLEGEPVKYEPTDEGIRLGRVDLLPPEGVAVMPSAVIGRLVFRRSVTNSGLDIDGEAIGRVHRLNGEFTRAGREEQGGPL